MIKPVGYENMTPVQIALFCARLWLSFLHGLNAVNPDNPQDCFTIDTSELVALIDKATLLPDKPVGKNGYP